MKTKTRGLIKTRSFTGVSNQFYADGRPYQFSTPTRSYQYGMTGVITYDDTKRPKSDKTTRRCSHTTYEIEGFVLDESYYTDASRAIYCDSVSGMYNYDQSGSLSLPDVSAYAAEAFDFFKAGCVDQTIDLGANLFEIKQAVKLLPNLKTTFERLARALQTKSVKYTLKNSADLHLAYSFGIKPLYSDVAGLIGSVKSLHNHILWLRKNSGKPTRVDFRKDLSSPKPGNTTLFTTSQEQGWNIVTEYQCTYHAFATVVYDVSALSNLELQLRYFVRQLGLDKPFSTAWELLPWSFLIDWALNVGQWLSRIAPAVTLPTKFLDLGYSIKVVREDVYRLQRLYPRIGSGRAEAKVRRMRYERYRGLPTSYSVIAGQDLSARKLALSMSLALQKWR